jgi:hypothetical protein
MIKHSGKYKHNHGRHMIGLRFVLDKTIWSKTLLISVLVVVGYI